MPAIIPAAMAQSVFACGQSTQHFASFTMTLSFRALSEERSFWGPPRIRPHKTGCFQICVVVANVPINAQFAPAQSSVCQLLQPARAAVCVAENLGTSKVAKNLPFSFASFSSFSSFCFLQSHPATRKSQLL